MARCSAIPFASSKASSGWAFLPRHPAGRTVRIDVDKLAFTPAQVSAHVGDTIEWANGDFVAHTATGRKKEWDVTIPAKGIGRVINLIEKAGIPPTITARLSHPNMVGRVAVAD